MVDEKHVWEGFTACSGADDMQEENVCSVCLCLVLSSCVLSVLFYTQKANLIVVCLTTESDLMI